MPGLIVSAHAWGDCLGEICCLQHGEMESNVTGDPLHSRAACTQPCNVNTHSRAHCSPGARLCEQWGHGCVNNGARLCASARLCRGSPVNVWNTFVWTCPTWPSRWGMRISIDWPRLKSCQAVCDECMRGEIYSSLSRDAGWRDSRVTKIWGSGHDHGFVLFLFATTGFHIQ